MGTPLHYCRSCNLPLELDDSLKSLTPAKENLLTLNYAEQPSPIRIEKGEESSKSPIHDIPRIPQERVDLFKEAVQSNSGRRQAEETKYDISKYNPSTSTESVEINSSSNKHSFVYLDDKQYNHSDFDHYSDEMLQNGNNSPNVVRPFRSEEIKDLVNKKSNISERVESLEKIFNIISMKYEIDYPVCSDCANTLVQQMKHHYDTLNKEKDVYMKFLKKLTSQNGPNVEKTNQSLNDLKKLGEEEEAILYKISEEDEKHLALNKEIEELELELQELNTKEQIFVLEKNKFELEMQEKLDELDRVQNQYTHNMNIMDLIRSTDVFGTIFEISHSGKFGTINGLRLGCLDDIKVTWHEINAALGQLALLIATCIHILDTELDGYRLIPMGSTSRIEKFTKDLKSGKVVKSTIKLYSTGDFSIGGFFAHNNLDVGMVCLVAVMQQVADHIAKIDKTCKIPYMMAEDKVGGYCVRPSSRSGWESWTNSCRCLLTNARWILLFCITYYNEKLGCA